MAFRSGVKALTIIITLSSIGKPIPRDNSISSSALTTLAPSLVTSQITATSTLTTSYSAPSVGSTPVLTWAPLASPTSDSVQQATTPAVKDILHFFGNDQDLESLYTLLDWFTITFPVARHVIVALGLGAWSFVLLLWNLVSRHYRLY